MSELVIDRRIVWDPMRLREVDEAKSIIMGFLRQGYEILLGNGQRMERFRPELQEVVVKAQKTGMHTMKILSETGDDRIVWDKENGNQAKEAKAKFNELIKKDYKAYSVDSHGKKHAKISEFDLDAEEILMIPPTVKG